MLFQRRAFLRFKNSLSNRSLPNAAQVRGMNAEDASQVADFEHIGGAAGHNIGPVPVHFALEISGDFVLADQGFLGMGVGMEQRFRNILIIIMKTKK